jgi:predicted HTH domain antitoxin
MKVTVDIPAEVEQALQQQLGHDLTQAAKEAMAVSWYRAEKLSIGQVATLLGISTYDADGLMKQHGVAAPYSTDDFKQDQITLDRLLGS